MISDTQVTAMELGSKGYSCAQIILLYGLQALGRENADLIRAMAALKEGGGCSGQLCGALSGGLCLLGLHLGKGQDPEQADERESLLYAAFVDWFTAESGGEITCDDILAVVPDGVNAIRQYIRHPGCGALVYKTCDQVMALLLAHGIDPSVGRE